jgi:hypothetical protein
VVKGVRGKCLLTPGNGLGSVVIDENQDTPAGDAVEIHGLDSELVYSVG